jgi:hypothetical protein
MSDESAVVQATIDTLQRRDHQNCKLWKSFANPTFRGKRRVDAERAPRSPLTDGQGPFLANQSSEQETYGFQASSPGNALVVEQDALADPDPDAILALLRECTFQ